MLDSAISFSHITFLGTQASERNFYALQLGGSYLLSHHWRINILGGGRLIDSDNPNPNPNPGINTSTSKSSLQLGNIFSSDLSYTGQFVSAAFRFSRSVSPSGIGALTESNHIGANLSYRMSRRFSFNINGTISDMASIASQENLKRRYYSASTGITWDVSRDLKLKTSYRYQSQESSRKNYSGDSNAIMLFLNYDWPGITY
jgi:hypothetical protein